jgi:hypothetical protein
MIRRVSSTVLRGGDTVTYALLPDSRKHGFGWRGGVVILPSTLTDLVAYKDLMVRNIVKNRHSCKSIGDAACTQYSESVVGGCQLNVPINLQVALS